MLGAAQATNTIALLALSTKPTPTSVLRNVALSVKGKIQMGYLSQPSSSFLEKFGNPTVPSVFALIPPSGTDNQFQVIIYILSLL